MANYFVSRAKEWSTWLGVGIGVAGAVIPQFVPAQQWAHIMEVALPFVSALLMALPHNASSTVVENDGLTLLRALAAALPNNYADKMQPIMASLATALVQKPQLKTEPVVASIPAPVPAVPVDAVQATPVVPAASVVPAVPVIPTPQFN